MAWNGYSEKGQGSQERGPATFTYNPNSGPSQQVGLGTQLAQGGQRGGGVTGQIMQVDQGTDGTKALTGLLSIAADRLAPVAKKMQENAFLDGMTRAAAGQEMTNIINERPWFTKIFGDTPVVEGARAYKAQEATANFQAHSSERMAELRQQPPEAMANYAREQFEVYANTGDPDTDRLIKNSIAKVMPELVRVQTREHVKWQQERASEAQLSAWDSSAAALQQQLGSGQELTPEMGAEFKAAFGAGLAPPPGADLDSWNKNLTTSVAMHAQKGNFHAIRAMEEMGAFAHMKMEDRLKLEPLVKRYELEAASTSGHAAIFNEYMQMKQDVSQGRTTPEELLNYMHTKDAEYRARTGSSVGLFALPEKVSLVGSAQSARAQLLAAQQKAALAAEEAGLKSAFTLAEVRTANPAYVAASSRGSITKTEATEAAEDVFAKTHGPDRIQLMKAWASNPGYDVPTRIKSDLARVVAQGNPTHITPDFIRVATMYDELGKGAGGLVAQAEWFDPKPAELLRNFVAAGGLTGEAKEAAKAFEVAKYQADMRVTRLDESTGKEVNSFLDDKLNRGGMFFDFTKTKPNAAARQLMGMVMAEETSNINSLTGTARYEQAWARAQRRMQPLGKYVYTKDPTREVDDLETIISKRAGGKVILDSDAVHEATNEVIAERLKLVGGHDSNQIHVLRHGDRAGVAEFTAIEYPDDGAAPRMITFTSDDLYDRVTAIKQKNLTRIHKSNTRNRRTLAAEQAEERYQRELNK